MEPQKYGCVSCYSCVMWLHMLPFLRPAQESDDMGQAWSRLKEWVCACTKGPTGNTLQSPEIAHFAEETATEDVVDYVREV